MYAYYYENRSGNCLECGLLKYGRGDKETLIGKGFFYFGNIKGDFPNKSADLLDYTLVFYDKNKTYKGIKQFIDKNKKDITETYILGF